VKRTFKLLFAGALERQVGRLLRRNPHVRMVAVGGSVGKTSTKLAIAAVLKQGYRVHYQEGNFNDPISIPLSIMNLPVPPLYNPFAWALTFTKVFRIVDRTYPDEIILVELGTDQPGDIPHFMKYLKPDIGVVTATTPEHIEMFKTTAAVIDEEFTLASHSQIAVVNGDDEGIRSHIKDLKLKVVTYGASGAVHFSGHKTRPDGGISTTLHVGGETVAVKTRVTGHHSLYALAAAAAVGRELGLSGAKIVKGLESFKPVAGRMNLLPGANGSIIIDDSYNASPDAVIAAITALEQTAKGRAIAVLGNMNELGSYARTGHEQVGAACGNLDLLVTIGASARDMIAPAAKNAGLKANQVQSFLSPYAAGEYLRPLLRAGDTVLVKGSQNRVFSEEATALLLRNDADRSKLVRQTPDWLAKKQAQFKAYE